MTGRTAVFRSVKQSVQLSRLWIILTLIMIISRVGFFFLSMVLVCHLHVTYHSSVITKVKTTNNPVWLQEVTVAEEGKDRSHTRGTATDIESSKDPVREACIKRGL